MSQKQIECIFKSCADIGVTLSNDDKLEPCPFCGEKPRMGKSFLCDTYWVACLNREHNNTPYEVGETETEAMNAWNRRPLKAELQARIAKLEAALREIVDPVYYEINERRCTCQDYFKGIALKALEES